jgi:hypothetical protein
MLKKILIGLAVLIAGILIAASFRPDTFRVERSITIKASPEKIHPYLNDFKLANTWSPWVKLDPALKDTYSGAASGVGAAYAWSGNRDVGKGSAEIIESTPSKVLVKMHFMEPMEGVNTSEYVMKPQGDSTQVTWAMFGPQPYIAKLMCMLFFDQDKMIGGMFEKGLVNLKEMMEK